jgi:DNA polymerase-1
MRREAKTINFGIIYGMGVGGLAEAAEITREEAREFMDKYFSLHQGIREHTERTIELAREKGYVETLFGRRRYLPEINSGVQQVRAAAERMAVNMPIQGTAADLMKMAMIEVYKRLAEISPKSKMILQVHDELVFEVPDHDLKKVAEFVKKEMENIFKLRVPIKVEVEAGDNWGQLKEI